MIANIQALRAIAALLVVLHHLKELIAATGLPDSSVEFAALGVDLFFVISGFIMVYTTDQAPVTGVRFIKNRVARIAPIYWLITIFVFIVALAAPELLDGTSASMPDFLRSLLFIPYARGDGQMLPLFFLGWSLNYEMFFYLIFAAALVVGRGRHVEIAIAFIMAAVLYGLLSRPPAQTLTFFYSNTKMLEFAAGMVIARVLSRMPSVRGIAIGMLVIGSAWLVVTPLLFQNVAATLSATGACSLILIGALSAERAGVAVRRPFVMALGDASYSLYLIHPFVTQTVTMAWRSMAQSSPAAAPVAILAGMVLSVGSALLLYRLVERPLSRATRRLLDTSRQPVPARGL